MSRATMVGGFPLPPSYREFSREYGYGKVGGLVIVLSPAPAGPDSIIKNGERLRGFIQEAVSGKFLDPEPDGSLVWASQLYPWAASENGEYFVWRLEPPAPKFADGREYPIYCIGARMASIRYAARDVWELWSRLAGDDIRQILGSGYQPLPKTFKPL